MRVIEDLLLDLTLDGADEEVVVVGGLDAEGVDDQPHEDEDGDRPDDVVDPFHTTHLSSCLGPKWASMIFLNSVSEIRSTTT